MENNNLTNNFTTGINTDIKEIYQPEGTYRYALNAINQSKRGELGTITNEPGNVECFKFQGYEIGSVNIGSNDIVYFLKDPDQIVLANSSSCTYTVLFEGDCLNFQKYVQAVYRLVKGCERVIYFVDGVNNDRVINIDNLDFYKDDNGNFLCNQLDEKPEFAYPCISNITVSDSGGNLPIGTYELSIQYEDENGYATSFVSHSLPFPVAFSNTSNIYKYIGGDNLLYPLTNKSISLTLDNVDTSFKSIIISLSYTNSNSITRNYRLTPILITGPSLSYTIVSLTSDVTDITLEEIITPRNPYTTSETLTQLDNRLIKANVKSKYKDYSSFQIEANKIEVNYVTKPIPIPNPLTKKDIRKEGYYTDTYSYMRDEIYSLGIVWVFKDGTESPVFHIPGREKNKAVLSLVSTFPNLDLSLGNRNKQVNGGWDSTLIKVGFESPKLIFEFAQHIPETEFVKFGNEYFVERWKVYNTCLRVNKNNITSLTDVPATYTKGELGYYESTFDYPSTVNCDEVRIYPLGKIRHHRMPDTNNEEHFISVPTPAYPAQQVTLPLGLEFTNINPPLDYVNDVQGYYIVREKRTGNNKTVLDKGIIYNNAIINVQNENTDGAPKKSYVQTTTYNRHRFSRTASASNLDSGSLIPVYSSLDTSAGETELFEYNNNNPLTEGNIRKAVGISSNSFSVHCPVAKFKKDNINADHVKLELNLVGKPLYYKYESADCDQIERRLTYGHYYNFTRNYNMYAVKVDKTPIYVDANVEIPQGYLTNQFVNSCQQESLVFETPTNNPIPYLSQSDSWGGTDVGNLNVYYVGMKKYNPNMYGDLSNNTYIKTHTCLVPSTSTTTSCFGGDTFITLFNFFRSSVTKMIVSNDNSCKYKDKKDKSDQSGNWHVEKNLVSYYVESEINTSLRHVDFTSTAKDNTFFPYNTGLYNDTGVKNIFDIDWMGSDGDSEEGTGGFTPWKDSTYAKNKYLYNLAFSRQAEVKPYFSLDRNYKYCSECLEEFKFRIINSEQGTQEQTRDNYRIFLANNYRDIPANTGEITNLFVNFDEIYVHTERSLFQLVTRPQQIQTNASTLFIGTGDFLAVPPKELVTTDYGYLGSSHKQAIKINEFGAFFYSDLSKSLFHLTGSSKSPLQNIALKGISNFLQNEGTLYFNEYYKQQFGIEYPLVNQPSIKNGIGFLIGYDPRFKRILFTKKDYKPITPITPISPVVNYDFNDKTKFENKSWTISYSLYGESFISYHSYLPTFYSNDSFNLITSDLLHNNSAWKHVNNRYQTFYGKKYDFIINYIARGQEVGTLEGLYYLQDALLESNDEERIIPNETFKHIIISTTEQSTGKQPLLVKANPFDTILSNSIFVNNTEKLWSITNIRDENNNLVNLFSKNWNDIRNDYPIDKVPNPLAFGTKDIFTKEMLRDRYFNVRLFYNSLLDYKITFDLASLIQKQSIR